MCAWVFVVVLFCFFFFMSEMPFLVGHCPLPKHHYPNTTTLLILKLTSDHHSITHLHRHHIVREGCPAGCVNIIMYLIACLNPVFYTHLNLPV